MLNLKRDSKVLVQLGVSDDPSLLLRDWTRFGDARPELTQQLIRRAVSELKSQPVDTGDLERETLSLTERVLNRVTALDDAQGGQSGIRPWPVLIAGVGIGIAAALYLKGGFRSIETAIEKVEPVATNTQPVERRAAEASKSEAPVEQINYAMS